MMRAAAEQHPLVGSWKLVSLQSIVEGEPPKNAFGEKPNGYLIATAGGRLMALFTAS